MSNASVAEEASAACESTYSAFDLDSDIYDLKRMLHAAEVLQIEGDGDEDSASSARLLVEKAAKWPMTFTRSWGRACCSPNLAAELTLLMQDVIVDATGALYAVGQRIHRPSARLQRRTAPTRARRYPLAACVPS